MHVRELPLLDAAIDAAERSPNVYLETPGIPLHSKLREAVERSGPDRVLYGSDTPFHHPSVELAKVRASGLSTDLADRELGENGRPLFFGEQMRAAVAMTASVVEASRGLLRGEPGPDLPPSRDPVNAPRRRRSRYA